MDVGDELTRLIALTGGRIGGVVRQVCAQTLGLPPLSAEVAAGAILDGDAVVVEFAEQFSIDVSVITDRQRSRLWAALGDSTFGVVVQMYIADFAPRVRAGLAALGLPAPWPSVPENTAWDGSADPSDAVFNGFLPAVARLRALDAVTSEVVRLRGAAQHNCQLCKSLREGTALDAGGSETLYDDIAGFETSARLSERHKAALRYVDALIWSPARIGPDVAAGVRRHFSDDEAVELTRRDAQCQQQDCRRAGRRCSAGGAWHRAVPARRRRPDGVRLKRTAVGHRAFASDHADHRPTVR